MEDNNTALIQWIRRAAGPGPIQRAILDAWQATRTDWSYASSNIHQVVSRSRDIHSSERRFIADVVYNMIRNLLRIDFGLQSSGLVSHRRAPDIHRLLGLLLLEYDLPVEVARKFDDSIDWNIFRHTDDTIGKISKRNKRLSLRYSIPEWMVDTTIQNFADQTEPLLASLNERAQVTTRANRLKTTQQQLIAAFREKGWNCTAGTLAPDAVVVSGNAPVFSHPSFLQGWFEMQDEGSQLLAEMVQPPPGATIVDYCAGAGGKSLALAAIMRSKGRIVATDVDGRKLAELRKRARRAGASNLRAVSLDDENNAEFLGSLWRSVDRCLVDAPCTGTGTLRRNPELRFRLQPGDERELAAKQLAICKKALEFVKPGGRLIYSTCSLWTQENQGVVDALLASDKTLELFSLRKAWGAARVDPLAMNQQQFLQLLPHVHGTDGFFGAILRRLPS